MKGAPALRRRYLDRAVARSWPRYATVAGRLRRARCSSATSCCAGCAPAAAPTTRCRPGRRSWPSSEPRSAGRAAASSRALREPFAAASRGDRRARRGRSSCATRRAGPRTRRASWPSSRRAAPATSSAAARRRGPHHDELAFAQGERDLRSYGSQGEQRSAVLALLTAEADLVREVRGVRPRAAARRRRQRARPRPRAEPARPAAGSAARCSSRPPTRTSSAKPAIASIRVDDGQAHPE